MIQFLSVFPPFRGGISRFSDHVLQQLHKYDTVEAINYTKQYPALLFPGKTQLLPQFESHESKRLVHAYNPFNWISLNLESTSVSHFIYSHWHPFFATSTMAVLKKVKKKSPQVRISAIVHNVLPHEPFPLQNRLTDWLFKHTDQLITLSTQGTNAVGQFENHQPKVRQLFHPIYEPVELTDSVTKIREELGVPANAFVLLFFGLIREYKGLDVLIEAFNQAAESRKDIFLIIAGEFYEPQIQYEEQIRPEFMDRVQIRNYFLPDKEAAKILKASDVLILPYKSATQSGVLADAIAQGLPAIATNEPGFTDFIENGKSGIIMKTKNADELTRLILQLSQTELNVYRHNLNEVRKKFSWQAFGEEIFHQLIKI